MHPLEPSQLGQASSLLGREPQVSLPLQIALEDSNSVAFLWAALSQAENSSQNSDL